MKYNHSIAMNAKCKIVVVFLCGVLFGAGGLHLVNNLGNASEKGVKDLERESEQVAVKSKNQNTEIDSNGVSGESTQEIGEREEEVWYGDEFENLTGKWVSVDGEQQAEIDFRVLQFGKTIGWRDIEGRRFLLGKEMQFLSEDGFYTISFLNSEPDRLTFIKQSNDEDNGLCSFTLYKEGHAKARSMNPFSKTAPPARVQAILDKIATLKEHELKDDVWERLGLEEFEKLDFIAGESGLGESDHYYSLGIDNHWILNVTFITKSSPDGEDTKLIAFQLFQDYVDSWRAGYGDVRRIAYPYYFRGKVIHIDGKQK